MRTSFNRIAACSLLVLAVAAFTHAPAKAAIGAPYDTPTLSCVVSGETEITLQVTAGPSGAPAGVTIQWMTKDDYDSYGWLDSEPSNVQDPHSCALSLSGQPSYTGNAGHTDWQLGSNGSFEVKIGELPLYETGVSVHGTGCDQALVCGTTYVFRVFAHATNEHKRSDFSANTQCTTADCPGEDCTLTIGGYGQNGPGDCDQGSDGKNFWPPQVISDAGMSLGATTNFYTVAQLCAILNLGAPGNEPGNCYRQLARQLIAAKFNVLWGATCDLATTNITAADALIGTKHIGSGIGGNNTVACPSGSAKAPITAAEGNLDLFNNGYPGCPAHCDGAPQLKSGAAPLAPAPTHKASWGSLKAHYR